MQVLAHFLWALLPASAQFSKPSAMPCKCALHTSGQSDRMACPTVRVSKPVTFYSGSDQGIYNWKWSQKLTHTVSYEVTLLWSLLSIVTPTLSGSLRPPLPVPRTEISDFSFQLCHPWLLLVWLHLPGAKQGRGEVASRICPRSWVHICCGKREDCLSLRMLGTHVAGTAITTASATTARLPEAGLGGDRGLGRGGGGNKQENVLSFWSQGALSPLFWPASSRCSFKVLSAYAQGTLPAFRLVFGSRPGNTEGENRGGHSPQFSCTLNSFSFSSLSATI